MGQYRWSVLGAGHQRRAPGASRPGPIPLGDRAHSVGPSALFARTPAVATVSPQPGGRRPGARSASGASTKSRSRALAWGTWSHCGIGFAGSSLRAAGGRSTRMRVASEDEEVEVELAGTPALAGLSPEGALDHLQREQQGQGAGLRVGAGRDVEGDDRVAELRLVRDADGRRRVEARDAGEAGAGQRGEGVDARCQRGRRVAEVGAEADVGPDTAGARARDGRRGRERGRMPPRRSPALSCRHAPRIRAWAPSRSSSFIRRSPPVRVRWPPRSTPRDASWRRVTSPGSGRPAPRRSPSWRRSTSSRSGRASGASPRRADTPGLVVLGSGAMALARPPTTACSWPPPPPTCRVRWPTTATQRTQSRWRARPCSARPAGPSGRQRPAALARGGRRLPRGRPPPAAPSRLRPGLARRHRARWRRAADGRPGASPSPRGWSAFGPCSPTVGQSLPSPGGSSSGTLAALERRAACRVRALIEERGLRAASRLAQGTVRRPCPPRRRPPSRRRLPRGPPAPRPRRSASSSTATAPKSSGGSSPGSATRPSSTRGSSSPTGSAPTRTTGRHPEDRFASDLLLPDRSETRGCARSRSSAVDAPIPVLLGGHTLVGPGLRLLAEQAR